MSEEEAGQKMENKCPKCGASLPSGVLAGLCPACLFQQGAANDTAAPPETAAFQPPSVEVVAALFPQLEIIQLLGKGGMGAVYKARQPGLDRIVALKILPPQSAGGAGFIERFNREARALAKLNHPNIVAVYEFGQVNGLPFFIMEFVDGLDLRQLERAGKLTPREALQIVPQICEALQFAHDEGIVHRDIKPENILLDKKGRVKIADFGIAKILGREQDVAITETGGAIGTPHYMAPEQMEKPTTVDHRADIFSLGVVFYEMLTGELPLGKFSPPSSCKVEVDVRLDDVVLRALEKDPERRYQHASQVKTAVDTIAGSAAPPIAAPAVNAGVFARQVLDRDYTLDIRSCVRRGWALVRSDFWPFVGITALILALLTFASSLGVSTIREGSFGDHSVEMTSAFAILVWGPLMGGLCLYFLKKIRSEKATVETAFCGFSHRFLHLFLAGFVTSLLTWLGFICLVLPGIYLLVAWMFTLPLVVDKQMEFWPAMELSRKMVTKHWWKLLGFALVMSLLFFGGVLLLVVGVFVMSPLILAALMYAYEDIFSGIIPAAAPAPLGFGPSGTAVLPGAPPRSPRSIIVGWSPATRIALAALVLLVGVLGIKLMMPRHRPFDMPFNHREVEASIPPSPPDTPELSGLASTEETADSVKNTSPGVFGPVIERELQARATGTNQFLNLDTERLLTPSAEVTNALATSDGPVAEDKFWKTLNIPKDSRRFQYISWLQESGADLMFDGNGQIISFDGIFRTAHGDNSTNWDDWDGLTPEQTRAAIELDDWERRAAEARTHGEPLPPAPVSGGSSQSAIKLHSLQPEGPAVNLLTRDQSVNWFFKTREGRMGILQIVRFSDNPPAATIRYKLLQQATADGTKPELAMSSEARKATWAALDDRLEAASSMNEVAEKDQPLAAVATDAAKVGAVNIVKRALGKMFDPMKRDGAAHDAARLLAKRGQRKQAIELAKGISDYTVRDQTLSELAE
jgi:predicted Ser/Thr protein kinase